MTDSVKERLYGLVPTLYRMRDAERGAPLRALLAVIDTQVGAIEGDIARLYENWFIETCEEWVVPYIGDLVGVRSLTTRPALSARAHSQRAHVANVLSYRRRKGTAAMLEQLAQDLTGWPAHAVELFQLLATNQHLNHLRMASFRTPDLRDDARLGLLGGPFEDAAHTVDVRRIASGRGRYNLPNVAILLWRLASTPIVGADATVASDGGGEPGFFRFSPLDHDGPLFNRRHVRDDVAVLATEDVVPGALRRRALFDDLAAFRTSRRELGADAPADSDYFGTRPVVVVRVDGVDLPVEALRICDLAEWHHPPDVTPIPGTWPDDSVALDPVLGRIAFAKSVAPTTAPRVSYYRAFSGALGGGGYPRAPALPAPIVPAPVAGGGNALEARVAAGLAYDAVSADDQQKRIARLGGRSADEAHAPVAERLAQLLGTVGRHCIVEVADSRTYSLGPITVPAGSVLEIRAADGHRPVLVCRGGAPLRIGEGGVLILDGVLLTGAPLDVAEGPEAGLLFVHSTIVPGLALTPRGHAVDPASSAVVGPAATARFDLLLYRSISGPLRTGSNGRLFLDDSIVDDAGGALPAITGGHASVARTTVFGATDVEVLDLATDSIFTGLVRAVRTQEGCVRFSFVPDGSRVSQPYRCQPAMALQAWARMPPDVKPDRDVVLSRVVPSFTSTRYADPAYAQLTATCAPEIRRGASDEGSMGAFNFLEEPAQEDNLRTSLDEYLRFGLEAGIFYVT